MKSASTIFLSLLLIPAAGTLHADPPVKILKHQVRFISLSWNTPRSDEYARRLPDLEKNCPADGLAIEIIGKPRLVNGKKFIPGTRTPMGKIAWKYEDFTDVVADLKKAKSKIEIPHNMYPVEINIFLFPKRSLTAPINKVVKVAAAALAIVITGIKL